MTELRRPIWPGYILTVFAAGLGHCYLAQWKRGVAWFVCFAVGLAFLSARSISGALEPGEPFFVTALQFEQVAYVDVAVPLSVLVVCLLDLYLVGLVRQSGPTASVETHSNGT